MITEIRDILDAISIVISSAAGLFAMLLVNSKLTPALEIARGKSAVGGEIFFYAVIFIGIGYFGFQILTQILHAWYERR